MKLLATIGLSVPATCVAFAAAFAIFAILLATLIHYLIGGDLR